MNVQMMFRYAAKKLATRTETYMSVGLELYWKTFTSQLLILDHN